MDTSWNGKSGAEIDELPDPVFLGEQPYDLAEKMAIMLGHPAHDREMGDDFLRSLAIGIEIVLAAQIIIIHPGDIWCAGIDAWPIEGRAEADRTAGHVVRRRTVRSQLPDAPSTPVPRAPIPETSHADQCSRS